MESHYTFWENLNSTRIVFTYQITETAEHLSIWHIAFPLLLDLLFTFINMF